MGRRTRLARGTGLGRHQSAFLSDARRRNDIVEGVKLHLPCVMPFTCGFLFFPPALAYGPCKQRWNVVKPAAGWGVRRWTGIDHEPAYAQHEGEDCRAR